VTSAAPGDEPAPQTVTPQKIVAEPIMPAATAVRTTFITIGVLLGCS
jgi:hypothetical protein